jgi:hypothetical protein
MGMNDVDRLVAIEAIRSLQSRFVRYIDCKDWLGLSRLFVAEGSFILYGVDGKPQATLTGGEQIRTELTRIVGCGTTIHHLFSYEIDIKSPTAAHGIWAMEDLIDRTRDWQSARAILDFKTLHGLGHYHVDYRKDDGTWLIASQKLYRTRLYVTR